MDRKKKPSKNFVSRMLHTLSGRDNFDVVKADNSNNPTSSQQQVSIDRVQLMRTCQVPTMLHRSSGRNNFDFVKADNTNNPKSSQRQISADQARSIQQLTSAAIHTATGTDHASNNKNKNPK